MNQSEPIMLKKIALNFEPNDPQGSVYRFSVVDKSTNQVVFLHNLKVYDKKQVDAITPPILCQYENDKIFLENNLEHFLTADSCANSKDLTITRAMLYQLNGQKTMPLDKLIEIESNFIDYQQTQNGRITDNSYIR